MRKFLTGKQRAVFNFVRQKIYNGFPPSLREIAEHCGFSYKRAFDHLRALIKKGYIRIEPGKARSIFLLPPYKDDTRHSLLVETDVPDMDIQKGDFLHIDTGKPIVDGEVILSTQGEIKRFCAGDVAFGKVVGFSRAIKELA